MPPSFRKQGKGSKISRLELRNPLNSHLEMEGAWAHNNMAGSPPASCRAFPLGRSDSINEPMDHPARLAYRLFARHRIEGNDLCRCVRRKILRPELKWLHSVGLS